MAKKQMLYTPDGYQELVEELNYLKTVRREEIKKLAIDLQFGPSLPAPEVMDVEPVYVPELAGNCAWYRITCGTKQKTLSFMMTVFS